ncbi:hypothetical protein [Streptomyces sp. NPDC089795]|uniref:hypothetical protein n=1 Tax=Streptomyces sp. NPDC089795 TaxID=3155297 RepID=UPI00341E7F5C
MYRSPIQPRTTAAGRSPAYAAAGVPARVLLLARVGGGSGADGGLEGRAEVASVYGCRE